MGPAGTPRTVVTPWASQSLWTYSASGALGAPPVWTCRSTKPGRMYMPVPSISVRAFGGAAAFADGHVGGADAADLGDAVALDDDVDWPARRRAGAVDHGDTADDHAVEGPVAFAGRAVGRTVDLDVLGGEGHGGSKCQETRGDSEHIRLGAKYSKPAG